VEACEHAANFASAQRLIDRQLADALAWFGKESYYYTEALGLRVDLAMKREAGGEPPGSAK
jgi:hypothetical protein